MAEGVVRGAPEETTSRIGEEMGRGDEAAALKKKTDLAGKRWRMFVKN